MNKGQNKKYNIRVPYEHKKTVYWVISDACNYRCEYCFTLSKKHSAINPLFVAEALCSKLNGEWEIILSGGEPFVQKKLFIIVDKLRNAGNFISIYTNFSAKPEIITAFLERAGSKLAKFFASLHLEYVGVDDFLNKVLLVEKKYPGFKKHLFVHIAGTKKNLSKLEDIKRKFFEAGVQLIVFPWLCEKLKFFKYTKDQKNILEKINNSYNLEDYKDFCIACSNYGLDGARVGFKGRKCPAGHESIFVIPTGGVYACLKSNRTKIGFLGNIFSDDFRLKEENTSCPFDICTYPASFRQYYWCLFDKNNKINI